MKLLYCKFCGDAKALHRHRVYCACGKVSGNYEADEAHATVSADALVIGLNNQDVQTATYYTSNEKINEKPKIPDVGYRTIRAWMIAPGARVKWEKEKKSNATTETPE